MKIVLAYQQSTCMRMLQYCSIKTQSQQAVESSILLTVDKCFKMFYLRYNIKKADRNIIYVCVPTLYHFMNKQIPRPMAAELRQTGSGIILNYINLLQYYYFSICIVMLKPLNCCCCFRSIDKTNFSLSYFSPLLMFVAFGVAIALYIYSCKSWPHVVTC